ncbi:superoxide dismutase family protein [Dokdonia sp. Hel_I_53]|uniref:superoxide dismutase family protein n=1 Tax=Dokdonia sp. Hel_I_53 TaxID=1566287 RepID=UPI00119BF2B5|nr:superoxide dismutase family protein [Dokdonia sp. Hel_I_53]TVZ51162.1 Cu-Zn family superoxide dismutase [Dokdonia sp. Hel_I_53]
MKTNYLALAIIATISLGSCKNDKKEVETKEDVEVIEVVEEVQMDRKAALKLTSKSNSNASGSVVFKEEDGMVKMTAVLGGLSEGTHAIHIHENADCSSEDGKSTGGHWNPTAQPHGKWNATSGFHKGDIGNFEADENGNGTITMSTDEWCIGCEDVTKNILGKAIIVHQGVDDFTSQPSGAAGARIACGGIIE